MLVFVVLIFEGSRENQTDLDNYHHGPCKQSQQGASHSQGYQRQKAIQNKEWHPENSDSSCPWAGKFDFNSGRGRVYPCLSESLICRLTFAFAGTLQHKNMGHTKVPRKQLSQLSGYPEHSLSTTLLNMKKKNEFVDYDKDSAWLTEAGWQAAQKEHGDKIEETLDNSSTHESLKSMHKLTGAKLKVFELLADGSAKSYEEIMKLIGCANPKSFGTYISALNSAKLTESFVEDGVKKLQLVESVCFPFGRPSVSF